MKYPSLDNAEGIAVLAGLCAAGYVLYQLTKGAATVGNAVSATLTSAENAVEGVITGVEGVASSVTSTTPGTDASANTQAVGDTGIDGVQNWPLPAGLGTDTTTTSGTSPSAAAPSAVQISNDMAGGLY